MTPTFKTTLTIYGYHSVFSALQNKQRTIYKIYALSKYKEDLVIFIKNREAPVETIIVDNNFFKKNLEQTAIHQGIMALVAPIPKHNLNNFLASVNKQPTVKLLILDQATDSRNVGAMIRSAVAFDVDALIVTKNNTALENGLMHKASAGGLEKIKIVEVTNLQNTFSALKKDGFWIIGLDPHTQQYLHDLPYFAKIALVLGSEGQGLRALTKKECDLLAKIPMGNNMESLNITSACAIALYELYKKIQ